MNRKGLSLLLLLPLIVAACSRGAAQSEQTAATVRQEKLINVEVQALQPSDLRENILLSGNAEAAHDLMISSEQGGTVQQLPVDRGDRVKKGQLLAAVSADIFRAQLAEAEANLRLKQAGLDKAKTLFERRSITQMQRLQAQVEFDAAEAAVAQARSRLSRAVIEAPIGGEIEERYADPGEMVQPGGQLFRLVDRSRIKIKSEFSERDVTTFKPGLIGRVQFDALPDTAFEARLTFVSSVADPATRTYPCQFELDNPRGMIRGGMHARIQVLKELHEDQIVVPQTALVETENGRSAFVVEDSIARRREVTVGASERGMVVVTGGLQPGEELVVLGQRDLVDGQKVRITGRKD